MEEKTNPPSTIKETNEKKKNEVWIIEMVERGFHNPPHQLRYLLSPGTNKNQCFVQKWRKVIANKTMLDFKTEEP